MPAPSGRFFVPARAGPGKLNLTRLPKNRQVGKNDLRHFDPQEE